MEQYFWLDSFMADVREYILRRIVKAQYKAGNTWHDATINDKRVEGDNGVLMLETKDDKNMTISAWRLISITGVVAGQFEDSITKFNTQGVLCELVFPLLQTPTVKE